MSTEGKISYEPEADVLTWEISDGAPIESAREVGNIIVHFTKHNVPVVIEILQASSFLSEAGQVLTAARGKSTAPAVA